jgi:uncharacterized phiE125 gp8 family phage protein
VGYVPLSEPEVEPVSLEEAKAQLKVETADEDILIGGLIVAARQYFERQTGRSLIARTWRLDLDAFPAGPIRLGWGPVSAVTTVSYIDSAAASTPMAAETDYIVDLSGDIGLVAPPVAQPWPWAPRRGGAVSVTYTAGYGPAATDVPKLVHHAIVLIVAYWYRNRDAADVGGPAKSIIDSYTIPLLG